ncbi:MAG: ankyrin repeat domain-containing protein [Candidatus Obscuribacterales bacterium]|nr:ankyrin repeat domain-containing protein [Candidatus Obscuribacterales bacterium]
MNRYNRFFAATLSAIALTTMLSTGPAVEAAKKSSSQVVKELTSETAKAHFSEAEKALGAGEYLKAVDEYTLAINDGMKDAKAYGGRALAYAYLSKFEESVKDYNRAIALNNDSSEAFYGRGAVYVRLGEHKKAIKDFDQTLKMTPQNAEALYSRAGEHDALKHYDKALADYDETIKADPKYQNAYYDRALTLSNMHENQKALEEFDKALAKDPDPKVDRLYARAVLLTRAGDFDQAELEFERIIRENRNYTDAYMMRGIASLGLGRVTSANSDFLQFMKRTEPDDPNLKYILIEYILANKEIGEKQFRAALEAALQKTSSKSWAYPMLEYLAGKRSSKQVIAKAKDDAQKTATYCYVGYNELLSGDPNGVEQLNWVVKNGNQRFTEYQLSQALLKRRVDLELSSLLKSIYENDLAGARQALAKGVDCRLKDSQDNCAIVSAVIHNNPEMVKLILEHGADPNQKLDDGRTALYFAAMDSRYGKNTPEEKESAAKASNEIIQILLSKNADVNAADEYGITPLMNAAESGHLQAVKLLLEKNADVSAVVVKEKADLASGRIVAVKGDTALKLAEKRIQRSQNPGNKDKEIISLLEAKSSKK